jgi:hypothetical protein
MVCSTANTDACLIVVAQGPRPPLVHSTPLCCRPMRCAAPNKNSKTPNRMLANSRDILLILLFLGRKGYPVDTRGAALINQLLLSSKPQSDYNLLLSSSPSQELVARHKKSEISFFFKKKLDLRLSQHQSLDSKSHRLGGILPNANNT